MFHIKLSEDILTNHQKLHFCYVSALIVLKSHEGLNFSMNDSVTFSWLIDLLIECFSAVLSQDIPHIFAMTLFEEYIYWTDWETKSINRAHKSLGTNKTTLISTLHRPMDIHIYHPYRQPEGKGSLTENKLTNHITS